MFDSVEFSLNSLSSAHQTLALGILLGHPFRRKFLAAEGFMKGTC